MINAPRQIANTDATFPAAPTPDLTAVGLDFAAARASVIRARGDGTLFAGALAAGLAADVGADRERVLDLVSLAAWRSGALALRDDALRRLEAVDADTAAATLGIAADRCAEFRARQATDRYWWPGREASHGYALAVGGFIGLGGAWISPPREARHLDDPGAFEIKTADQWWRLDSDVWGAHLTPIGTGRGSTELSRDGVTLVFTPNSHLVWVHAQDQP